MIKLDQDLPLVSVILPTYNRDQFLEETIDSVLGQSYSNFELLIIDDGSEDKTKDVISRYSDPRILVFYLSHRGRSAARNFALERCKGDFITFIDSDDLYNLNKIETQVNFFRDHRELEVAYTSAECFWEDEKFQVIHSYQAVDSRNIYELIAAYVPVTICLPTVMFKRNVFERIGFFDESLDRFEDTDYWRRIAKDYSIGAITEPTCLIRTHMENSLRNQDVKKLVFQVRTYGNKVLSEDSNLLSNRVAELVGAFYKHYGLAIAAGKASRFSGISLYFRGLLLIEKKLAISDDVMPLDDLKRLLGKSKIAKAKFNREIDK
jgi:glycosyltransferase involved in cell wall biosynthesis